MIKRLWSSWSIAMQLAVVAALVFVIAAAGAWWVDDRSAFAGWLEAVATVAAFGAAVVAARYAADVQRRETRRDEQRAREQRRAQADLVAAWIDSGPRYGQDSPQGPLQIDGLTVKIRNASQLPITRVVIELTNYVHGSPHAQQLAHYETPLIRRTLLRSTTSRPGSSAGRRSAQTRHESPK